MKKVKQYILILICIMFAVTFLGKPVYATTSELTIKDEGEYGGFYKKDGQLYYVVTISSKSFGGNLSSIKFKVGYDVAYLEMLDPEELETENHTLDLGEKGEFDDAIIVVDNGREWQAEYEGKSGIYVGNHIEKGQLISEDEIDLMKICFKVIDNQETKRYVYIDTQANTTQVSPGYMNQKIRFVTNGVELPEEITNPTIPGNNGSGSNGGSNGGSNEDSNGGTSSKPGSIGDKTTANGILPFAGFGTIVLLGIVVISVIMAVCYIRLRKMKDIK